MFLIPGSNPLVHCFSCIRKVRILHQLSYSKIFPLLVPGNAISYWDSSMRERVTSPWVSSCSLLLYLPSDFHYIHSTPSVYITAPYIMQSILNRSLMMYKVMVNCIPTKKHVWMDRRSDRLSPRFKNSVALESYAKFLI